MLIADRDIVVNGFVVQGNVSETLYRDIPYRGAAYRESWPLDDFNTPPAKAITAAVKEVFMRSHGEKSFSLWVVPDADLVAEYVALCHEYGVEGRVLMCSSKRKYPRMDDHSMVKASSFIGWDYVTPALDYSTIADDLFDGVPKLHEFVAALNDFGLFEERESMQGT
jgi:hypothetical protein